MTPTDTQILDWLADEPERLFKLYTSDVVNSATMAALDDRGSDADFGSEEWRDEERRQFRLAIMRQMARNAPQSTVLPVVPVTGHSITQDEIDAAQEDL